MKTYDDSFVINKPRRRWLKRIGCAVLILPIAVLILVILAIPMTAWHNRVAQQSLAEALAELDRTDPGWRLQDIEATREKIPEKENSARVVVAAAQLLPKNWPWQNPSDLFEQLVPEEHLVPADFEWLNQKLHSAQPALDQARKLAGMPRGRHRIRYQRNTLETPLNDQANAREIALLLGYDALLQSQIGDGAKAVASCRAALNAGRSIGDEPFSASQLIRSACVIYSCQAAEKALAESEPPPEELASLQRALEIEDTHPDQLIITRGERAASHALFHAVEEGDVSLNGLAGVKWSWPEYALVSIGRMDTLQDHVLMLSLMSRAIAIAQLPMHEQIDAERQLDQEAQKVRGLPRPPLLTGLLMPAMSKRGEYSRRTHAYIRCMIIALAAERYRREKKKLPDSLNQLSPQYLAAAPLDPFDGEPLRYRRDEDGVTIHSVGQDGVDNNGNLDREHPNVPGVDIGVRLWDVAKRRQPPQPKPHNDQHPR